MPIDKNPTETLARRLAAYIPVSLTRQILTIGLPVPGEPRSLAAAALFSDMSGFTAMSEELASDGPRGAEELNRVLLVTFTAMIDVIHKMGGAVSHFYGDAMSVYFPDTDGRAARRALACAQMMQQLMLTNYSRVVTSRPPGKNAVFGLTMKIGAGYGRCQELVVGQPASSMEFVLTGQAVDEAALAEKQATAGEVIASRAILEKAGLPAHADFERFRQEQFPIPEAKPLLNWEGVDATVLADLVTIVSSFVPPALAQRLRSTGNVSLAEHRPVTSMFVQFEFAGDEDDSSAIETAEMGRQLQRYYEWAVAVVTRFGLDNARVNRVLTGDKGNQLHIMFGAPVAPDAPDQAVRCALALQREQPAYIASQKIGLTVGKVFSGPVGATARREYTVVGDVVNLSARLMQICQPGGIWTDEVTANRTQQWIDYTALSPVQLKGKQDAIVPYEATTARTTTTQLHAFLDRWQRPLIGREKETDLLLGGMDGALRGVGGIAAISGPTGTGKSRLLAEGIRYWLASGGRGLLGVCYQHLSDSPYAPWQGIWRELFGLTSGMSVEEAVTAVVEGTRALIPDVGDDFGLWREVLGLPIPRTGILDELTAEARQARLFALVRRCFHAASKLQPLCIILEGLHWADRASLDLLDDLTAHLDGRSLFVAITFRLVEDLGIETLTRPTCVPIAISDLSPSSARQLLQEIVGTPRLPDAVEQHLGLRDRDGRDSPVNPLFLEEALNVMMGAGVLVLNGRVQVNDKMLAQMQLPDTIHGLLLARLDRLPPAGRDLLQVASVIGRQFAVEPLEVLSNQASRRLIIDLLTELSAAEMTRLITADPEWIYLFQHAMTHEVAYESLPFARRQTLHAAIADWLVERYHENLKPLHAVLAYHYSRTDIHEKGLKYALLAADEARTIFANQEAVELYKLAETHLTALGIEEHWQTAVHLYLSRGEALRFIGDFGQAIADVEQAVSLAEIYDTTLLQLAKSYNLLAELKCRQANYHDAQVLTAKVISELGQAVPPGELARTYQWSGMAASASGNYDDALDHLQKAEELCISANDNDRLARVLEAIAFVHYSQKKLELALSPMQRSVDISRNVSIPANVASSLNNIALIQLQLGRAEEALTTLNDAIPLVQDISRNFLARFLGNRAEVLSYLGRFKEANSDFEAAIDLFAAMDDDQGLLEVYLVQAYECFALLGQWHKARSRYEQARQIMNAYTDRFPQEQARLTIGLGQMELEIGSVVKALNLFESAVSIIEDKGFDWWRPVVFYFLGLCHLVTKSTTKAKEHFEKARKSIAEEGCPDYLPLILLSLASIESDNEVRLRLLQECIQSVHQRSRYTDKIKCLHEVIKLLSLYQDESVHDLARNCQIEASALEKRLN